jgi:hypothetical protein
MTSQKVCRPQRFHTEPLEITHSAETAAHLQSAEHKSMGKVLSGSLAAQAQSLADKQNEPVTKGEPEYLALLSII